MPGLAVQSTMVSVFATRGHGKDAQVLLLRRAGTHLHGVWSYVAGHLEPDEKAWQCALRELREETGLTPLALYSADCCESYYDIREECIAVVPAFVAMIGAEAEVSLNPEHDDHRWVSFDQATRQLPFGGQRQLLAHVQQEFVNREPAPALRMPTA